MNLLRKIDKINHKNIVPLLGVSLHKTKTSWNEGQRLKSEGNKDK